MAWEEESVDTGGLDLEESGGGKKPLKMIIIAVILIALGIAGWFAYKKFFDSKPKDGSEEEVSAEEEAVAAETPSVRYMVELKDFILNPASSDGVSSYVKIGMSVVVSTELLKTALEDGNQPHMAQTRDAILGILRSKSASELNDPDNTAGIKKEIQFKLNKIYTEGEAIDVLITDMVGD